MNLSDVLKGHFEQNTDALTISTNSEALIPIVVDISFPMNSMHQSKADPVSI